MGETRYNLSADDVRLLRDMADEYRRRRPPPRHPAPADDTVTAPEVYVVWVGPDGIPGLNDMGTTGTGTEAGTGTGSAQDDDEVGSAVCQVYRMRIENGARKMFGQNFTRRIHNLMTTAIPGTSWQLAVRDKFGTFWVVPIPLGMAEC